MACRLMQLKVQCLDLSRQLCAVCGETYKRRLSSGICERGQGGRGEGGEGKRQVDGEEEGKVRRRMIEGGRE